MRTCKKCGKKIPNERRKCLYCQKRKERQVRNAGGEIPFLLHAISDALARSAASRTAEYRYYADLFKDSKKKYRG